MRSTATRRAPCRPRTLLVAAMPGLLLLLLLPALGSNQRVRY